MIYKAWRPRNKINKSCFYVVPDIHGQIGNLNAILTRILPLRNDSKHFDQVVFLGDYIDRGSDSFEVLETLIALQRCYPQQTIFLRGNHEEMMLLATNTFDGLNLSVNNSVRWFKNWLHNGGLQTIHSYLKHDNYSYINLLNLSSSDPEALRSLLLSFLLKNKNLCQTHFDFLNRTKLYHEFFRDQNRYIFAHASCDPHIDLKNQSEEDFLWNRKQFLEIQSYKSLHQDLPWKDNNVVITGHNNAPKPFHY